MSGTEAVRQAGDRTQGNSWFVRALRSFLPASYPASVRANYAREMAAITCFSFLLAGIETGVVTVLVRKGFDGVVARGELNAIVAMLGASKAIANLTSFVWVRLNHGRDKLAFTSALQATCAIVVALLALVPTTRIGLYLFAAGVLLARMVWAGFITVRSTIWSANYERSVRATITGKLATIQVIVVGLLGIGLGRAMDVDERAFRVLLPAGAVLGMVGVLAWRRLRVRGHRALIERERRDEGASRPSFNPLRMVGILREDRAFAGYMACMFALGMGNLMVPPILAITVVERFDMDYLRGMLVTNTIPFLAMPIMVPVWARLLSRMHVIRFRIYHAQVFALANGLFFLAAMLHLEWLMFVAAAVQGSAFGGGALAWTLGHLDFAPPHRASQYMGVHVTLTGVRGVLAPFLGVALDGTLMHAGILPRGGVLGLSMILCLVGVGGFVVLERVVRDRLARRHEDVETTPVSRAGL